jgi:4-amino-4-deoxy-L-arabinose transferase-like glycosyltransferase
MAKLPFRNFGFRSLCAGVIVFAAVFVWKLGHLGLFLMDHSIIFESGYRVYLGQVPYKDFLMSYLPALAWLQGLFFRLFGVSFSSMVLPAAIFNAAGSAMAMRIVWILFPGNKLLTLACGLLTALWFQAPFGSMMHEQTGFTFNLAALWLLWEAWTAGRGAIWLAAAAGVLVFGGVLSKQNAGGFFIPVCLAVLAMQWAPAWKKMAAALAGFSGGFGAAMAVFTFWLFRYSDPASFQRSTLEIPAAFARQRLFGKPIVSIRTLIGHFTPLAIELMLPVLYFTALALIVVGLGRSGVKRREVWMAPLLALLLLGYEQLFQLTAWNDPQNCVPFIGLAFALVAAAFSEAMLDGDLTFSMAGGELRIRRRVLRRAAYVTAGVYFTLVAAEGYVDDVSRMVHFGRGVQFSGTVNTARADRLVWAHPTMVRDTELPKEEFEEVIAWLSRRPGNFFVFPDGTILYGLLGRVPPQPMLYFLQGHSYRLSDSEYLDGQILAELERNNVQSFVFERDSFMQENRRLGNFPRVKGWIESNFRRTHRLKMFDLWERIPAPSTNIGLRGSSGGQLEE